MKKNNIIADSLLNENNLPIKIIIKRIKTFITDKRHNSFPQLINKIIFYFVIIICYIKDIILTIYQINKLSQ
ncbi:hypothetical protein ECENHK_05775 [Enterobacter kobei]|nr:hypothetical protein ECENHK_05775 [Enterobacter kobei]